VPAAMSANHRSWLVELVRPKPDACTRPMSPPAQSPAAREGLRNNTGQIAPPAVHSRSAPPRPVDEVARASGQNAALATKTGPRIRSANTRASAAQPSPGRRPSSLDAPPSSDVVQRREAFASRGVASAGAGSSAERVGASGSAGAAVAAGSVDKSKAATNAKASEIGAQDPASFAIVRRPTIAPVASSKRASPSHTRPLGCSMDAAILAWPRAATRTAGSRSWSSTLAANSAADEHAAVSLGIVKSSHPVVLVSACEVVACASRRRMKVPVKESNAI